RIYEAGTSMDIPIPCITVSRKSGEELKILLNNSNVHVHIKAVGISKPVKCKNMILDFNKECADGEMLILGAHLDSFFNSPGAFDDLSGVLTAIEVLKLISPYRSGFKRLLRVIFFTAEENGLKGSISYVKRHSDELDKI